ncbi:hypothetical protein OIT41_07525 [Arthrobacter sp. YA7-1]|uniref:hypothetical protein n=1 Tax=Arthrobacter sp. YA7-1 TaxID=2987701 RepID=UPI002227A925|nr:hypothetical protein [Arthrobacter sp. YA7-1]UYY82883.1 hypothetical protein OIT41_07525 [Arthrobacter sp. YA7-1]
MLRDPVEFLACDVVVDLGGTLAVRAVGAAQIRRVRNPRGTFFPGSAAEAASLGTWAIKLAGTALRAVAEATTLSVAIAAWTVTEGLTVTVTERLAIAVTERLARIPITTRTITEGLTVTVTLAARAITKRLTIPVTEGLTIPVTETRARIPVTTRTITEGLTVTIAEGLTVTVTLAARAITKRLTVTVTLAARAITKRLTVTVTLAARAITKRLTIPVTETRARIPITTRTITKATALTIADRLPIAVAASGAVTVVPGTEPSGVAPGIVVGAERAALATATAEVAAIAAVVLSHDGFLLL